MKGICDNCGELCFAEIQDNGFDYEYGSMKGYHSDECVVSDCCEADVRNVDSGKLITIEEVEYSESEEMAESIMGDEDIYEIFRELGIK